MSADLVILSDAGKVCGELNGQLEVVYDREDMTALRRRCKKRLEVNTDIFPSLYPRSSSRMIAGSGRSSRREGSHSRTTIPVHMFTQTFQCICPLRLSIDLQQCATGGVIG